MMTYSVKGSCALLGLVALLGVGLLGQEPCTITVQPGQAIQEAIDTAPDGAVICLEAGEWVENIVITKSLTVRGIERGATTLRAAEDYLPVVVIQAPEASEVGVAISGVTIDGGGGREGYGVLATDGVHLTVGDCTVSGGFSGIELQSNAQATITDCLVSRNSGGVTLMGSAQASIEDCTISGNEYGVWVMGSAQATITACSISESGSAGIQLIGDAQATVTDCAVSGSGDSNIEVRERAQGTFTGCSVSNGGRFGIYLESSAQATIANNVIRDNERYGVALGEQPCFFVFGRFAGYVAGNGNTGDGNAEGVVCPDYLAFLFTEEGGTFDLRE